MFHKNLKALRIKTGLTQKQVAEQLHVSAQSVSKWEKGEAAPSIDFLPTLALCLGCDINAFFEKDRSINTNCEIVANFLEIMVDVLYHAAPVIDTVGPLISEHPWIIDYIENIEEKLLKYKTVNAKTIQIIFDCDENFAKVFLEYLVKLEKLEKLDIGDTYFVMKDAIEGFTALIKIQKFTYEFIKEKEVANSEQATPGQK